MALYMHVFISTCVFSYNIFNIHIASTCTHVQSMNTFLVLHPFFHTHTPHVYTHRVCAFTGCVCVFLRVCMCINSQGVYVYLTHRVCMCICVLTGSQAYMYTGYRPRVCTCIQHVFVLTGCMQGCRQRGGWGGLSPPILAAKINYLKMQETHFIAHAIFLCVMAWVSGVAPPVEKSCLHPWYVCAHRVCIYMCVFLWKQDACSNEHTIHIIMHGHAVHEYTPIPPACVCYMLQSISIMGMTSL